MVLRLSRGSCHEEEADDPCGCTRPHGASHSTQATIHTAGQHSAGCRQAIRDQAGDTQQYEPLRRDHKSGQGKCNTVQALQQMFAGWPGVLGPLGALGAVECEDVAKALTIVGFNPTLVVCVGKEATQAVKARINQTVRGLGPRLVRGCAAVRLRGAHIRVASTLLCMWPATSTVCRSIRQC